MDVRLTIVSIVVLAIIVVAGFYVLRRPTITTTTVVSTSILTTTTTKTLTETLTERQLSTILKTVASTKTIEKLETITSTVTKVLRLEAKPKIVEVSKEVEALRPKISQETQVCLSCHVRVTPGIVADWLTSRHAHITPGEALSKPELERRISSKPPERYLTHVIGCYECHGANPDRHPDTINHFGFRIHVIVTPQDCELCHAREVKEYSESVKANAYYILVENPLYMKLVNSSINLIYDDINVGGTRAFESSCLACHGTKVEFKGTKTVTIGTFAGTYTLVEPIYTGWPNHGVGRINPDGTKGACTACHPRHSFSIKVARSPYTCSQCHLDPDVPAFEVWKESKHGNIFLSEWKTYNMTAVPWVPGRDFRAPTCAVCHFSLLTTPEGEIIANRTHNPDTRIWIRLFGVYAHPQPKTGETWKIRNEEGQPLPYSLTTGEPASRYVINEEEMARRREQMIRTCSSCHSRDYASSRIQWFEEVTEETNKAIQVTTKLLLEAWNLGAAKGLPTNDNPFDEYIERLWIESWLFNANSIRYAAAMNGPDWAAFKRGWYKLTRIQAEMEHILELYNRTMRG